MSTKNGLTEKDSPGMLAVKQFTAGTIAGISQVLSGHPLDTIKVKLQMQNPASPQYTGVFDCIKQTAQKEGVRQQPTFKGFFKGMLSPIAGIAFVNAIIFGSYSQMKVSYESKHQADGTWKNLNYGLLPLHEIALCGAFAGLTNSFVASPVEMLKTQMQTQYRNPNPSTQFTGSFDAAKHILREKGPMKLLLGLESTIIREIPGTAGYYVAYEVAKRTFAGSSDPAKLPGYYILTSGALAGIGYWACCYPFDIIKSRIQAQSVYEPMIYKGWLDCAKTLYFKEGGVRAFYRGFSAALLRTIPASSVTFAMFEASMKYMTKKNEQN